jgi:hypothetical protein
MRTPWRFVADLVSRKPRADVFEEQSTKAIEYHPASEEPLRVAETVEPYVETDMSAKTEAAVHTSITTSEPAQRVDDIAEGTNDTADQVDSGATVKPLPSVEETAEHEVGPVKPAKAAASPGRMRRKMTRLPTNTNVIETDLSTHRANQPEAPRTLTEDMAALDTQIETLRRQLAEKLRLQNAQLRKMLDRFEPR